MEITSHGFDWCHLCRKWSEPLADILYHKNAEPGEDDSEYIRICVHCAHLIIEVATRLEFDAEIAARQQAEAQRDNVMVALRVIEAHRTGKIGRHLATCLVCGKAEHTAACIVGQTLS